MAADGALESGMTVCRGMTSAGPAGGRIHCFERDAGGMDLLCGKRARGRGARHDVIALRVEARLRVVEPDAADVHGHGLCGTDTPQCEVSGQERAARHRMHAAKKAQPARPADTAKLHMPWLKYLLPTSRYPLATLMVPAP